MKYLKLFNTHSQYESYTADTANFITPNVSYCLNVPNEVHYNPLVSVSGVELNKSELSLSKGETETLVATVLPSNASNKNVIWSSSNDSVATVSSNGLVTAVGDNGSTNITVTTVDGGFTSQCAFSIIDPYAGHEFVDLGLSVKWAKMNIGASSETDYGQYFQWGDISGYTAAQVGSGAGQKYFGWADYKYGNGTSSQGATDMTKYNSTDGKTTLEVGDDAAVANWGGSWRMPTAEEFNELCTASTITKSYTTVNGINGYKFSLTADPTKYVFFPAVGYCSDGSVYSVGSSGGYWSSSLYTNTAHGRRLFFMSGYCGSSNNSRSFGYSVRGVVG